MDNEKTRMTMLHISDYHIRKLSSADWQLFKTLRLEALQREAAVFSSTYARESRFPNELWQERLDNPEAAFYALYHGEEPVGITGIIILPPDNVPTLIASYIRAAHRGKGLSKLLYEARINWAKEKGCSQIVVAHRNTNIISKAANQRFGFRFTHTEMVQWPDGEQAEILYYVLDL